MPEIFAARLSDLFDLPNELEDILTPLEDIWSQIGLTNYSFNIQPPPIEDIGPLPDDPISEEDALDLLEWFEDELEEEPESVEVPQTTISPLPFPDIGSRSFTLQLQALSELTLSPAELSDISLVLNPGGFEATVITDLKGITVEFTVEIALRISSDIFYPMRKITESDGQIHFEPIENQPHVQVSLGEVDVTVKPGEQISFSELRLGFDQPVMIGETGFVLEIQEVELFFFPTPDDEEAKQRGLYIKEASLYLPENLRGVLNKLSLTDAYIGSDGFSGAIEAMWTPPLSGEFFGLNFSLSSLNLAIERNTIKTFKVDGVLSIPILETPLRIVIGIAPDGSLIFKVSPNQPPGTILPGEFYVNDDCLALQWQEPNINRWLKQVAADFFERNSPVESTVIMRALYNPTQEIRLDWDVAGTSRSFGLPGLIRVKTPEQGRFSLIFGAGDQSLDNIALLFTLESGATLTLECTFTWETGGERELHNDPTPEQQAAEPLIAVDLVARSDISLLLTSFGVTSLAALPTFFKQLENPLDNLFDNGQLASPEDLCIPTNLTDEVYKDFTIDDWYPKLRFNLESLDNFTLPFLTDGSSQFIKIGKPDVEPDKFNDDGTIDIFIPITVCVGPLEFESDMLLSFDLEKFAFRVRHTEVIKLVSETEFLPADKAEFLGLSWQSQGVLITEGGQEKYHHFTLVTQNYDYKIIQPEGASFELGFTGISKDSVLKFKTTEFELRPNGISLKTVVLDDPVHLLGIDTKFSFEGTSLRIENNVIKDFELKGTGPLPPALVGDAIAEIRLNFGQRGGGLKLIDGGADLVFDKPLKCQGTRFEFSVSDLGLSFYDDGKFHLYFLVSGKARFVLAPGDDNQGALGWLPNIELELVECPLTGDASVIANHVNFLIELPKKVSFDFLGCFEMELRGIGFVPQAKPFDGDGAMKLTGQVKFAKGLGDVSNPRVDYHTLLIGLPEPGKFVPRIYFEQIALNLSLGDAFTLRGTVRFYDDDTRKGFEGTGELALPGMPSLEVILGFMRVRENPTDPWVRAWFIFAQVKRLSVGIPAIPIIYLREIGLGFGYRYTLTSIKTADETNDIKKLLTELKVLSRTQGNLATFEAWSVDLEQRGTDPRWTIVLRGMVSQSSASASPADWNPIAEQPISCLYLFDAVVAFRSDFTFFMAVRGWINHNYWDYTTNADNIQNNPFFSGFVLLSPKQKRFLAHVASNPDGIIGKKPDLGDIVREALQSVEFSATLLIEPGLLHYELGWPNNLRWSTKLGPIKVGIEGGFIFRLTKEEFLIGSSFTARGELEIKKKYSAGVVGVSIEAYAFIAYGTRMIGVVSFDDPFGDSMYYYGAGLEIFVRISLKFWIKLAFIKKTFRLSVEIGFSGGFEFGIEGLSLPGIRGKGTVRLKVKGRGLRFSVEFGIRESVIEKIEDRIQGYLAMGLEASDGAYLPGVDPRTGDAEAAAATAQISRRNGQPSRTIKRSLPTEIGISTPAATAENIPSSFQVPGYSLFTIHQAEADPDYIYFVLLPQGEEQRKDGSIVPERGFLPVPPRSNLTVDNDFRIGFPLLDSNEQFILEYFDPFKNEFVPFKNERAQSKNFIEHKWKVNWDAGIIPYTPIDESGKPTSKDKHLTLAQYMRFAFRYEDGESFDVNPIGDPVLPENQVTLQDERIHNPSDAAFEAAVRGAYEQFKGSPYFKPDPNLEYDRVLREAFKPATSIYEPGADEVNQDTHPTDEQADQLRGVIIQDIIADLRDYAHKYANRSDEEKNDFTKDSIAFQMGLVFQVKKLSQEEKDADQKYPAWFDQISNGTTMPTIQQRNDPNSTDVSSDKTEIRPFNTTKTSFDEYPPKFERVRHYTSANTVGIAWDLTWNEAPDTHCTPCQADPEHHLLHYHIRRRSLDSQERERIFTVKPAEAVHRENGALNYLKPRFNLVDNFNHESDEEQANLPANGRSYLYTITPVDFAGTRGRPLSVVATRFPDKPPQVPVDGEFVVRYRLTEADLESSATLTPRLIKPVQAHIAWNRPKPPKTGPLVPIGKYCLIFRRKNTLPIGSYGLDSSFQGSPVKSLPTSNARPLPTDIKIMVDVDPDAQNTVRGGGDNRIYATVPVDALQAAGIIPLDEAPSETTGPGGRAAAPFWQPESWVVFFQTISVNGVPSSLAPVQLLLRVEGVLGGKAEALANLDPRKPLPTREERRPAEIEWLPYPLEFPMLPPEDMRAITANAHFPMPETFIFEDVIPNDAVTPEGEPQPVNHVAYRPHPAGIRTVRFRWNQGPSNMPDYPLDLNAGYHLLELDIDNHTTETFNNPVKLAEALRQIQEVQMLPPADLLLTPGDTLATSQWEAWYPSAMLRLRQSQADAHGSKTPFGPWYSWRESDLVWPEWPGLTDGAGLRNDISHPFLLGLVTALRENPLDVAGLKTYNVDLQTGPPMAPKTLLGLVNATPPEIDPYGWGLLQRFGLSITLALRDKVFNEVRPGEETVQAIQDVLSNYSDEMLIRRFSVAQTNFTANDISNNFNTTSARKIWKDAFDKMQITLPGSLRATRVIANEVWNLRSGSGNRSKTYRLKLINEKLIVYEVYAIPEAIKKHLTIDLLFQPGQSVELEETPAESSALLAITQISLRPAIEQRLRYGKLDISGPAGGRLELVFTGVSEPFSLINQSDPASGQLEIEPDPDPIKLEITLPLNGQTRLLFRGQPLPEIEQVNILVTEHTAFDQLSSKYFEYSLDPNPHLKIIKDLQSMTNDDRTKIGKLLPEKYKGIVNYRLTPFDKDGFIAEEFAATDELSSYFIVPVEHLAAEFSQTNSDYGKEWQKFKRYVEALTQVREGDEQRLSDEERIQVPSDAEEIMKVLPEVLAWQQRFFDASAPVVENTDGLGETFNGPFMATAYPRISTPAYATPDESGRLKYDHLIEDKWAHTYRYYIRPFHRYQLLLNSFRQSPALFAPELEKDTPDLFETIAYFVITANTLANLREEFAQPVVDKIKLLQDKVYAGRRTLLAALEEALGPDSETLAQRIANLAEKTTETVPDPTAGGLDVVLERTQPIRSPIVISSQRLDRPSTPENPAPPGKVWEVIVAKHAEQSLIERNQTLVRQLSFRQVAFTLMRRFAYQDWKELIETEVSDNHEIMIESVSDYLPDDLPGEYTIPNIIDLETTDETEQRSLDLPKRLPSFQQGALALQWDSLPFFYEHRLSLIAQAASVVSPVKDVIQRDFEYRSPEPEETTMEAIKFSWVPDEPYPCTDEPTGSSPDSLEVDGRLVHIRLRSLWDSLPESAQKHWPAENPTKGDRTKRKYSSLPDLEVVYQIIVTSRGNIEVQAEFFFDFEAEKYKLRQLGQQFLAAIKYPLVAPSATDGIGSPYTLDVTLQQITEVELARSYDPASLPYPTCGKLYFRDKETNRRQLVFTGVLTCEDWHNLLFNPIKELSEPSLQTFASRAVSQEVDLSGFEGNLEHPEPTDFVVVWTGGEVSDDEKDPVRKALKDLASDGELKEALKSIKDNTTILLSPLPTGRELPWPLRGKLDFSDPKGLRWLGDMSEGEKSEYTELEMYKNLSIFDSKYPDTTGSLRRAVNEILDGVTKEFCTPYDVPPNPADFSTGFSVSVEETDGSQNWILRWSGVASDEALAKLEQLEKDSDGQFKTQLNKLLSQIQNPNKSVVIKVPSGQQFTIDDVSDPQEASLPGSFDVQTRLNSITEIIWRDGNPITEADLDTLQRLTQTDHQLQQNFEDAIARLVAELLHYETIMPAPSGESIPELTGIQTSNPVLPKFGITPDATDGTWTIRWYGIATEQDLNNLEKLGNVSGDDFKEILEQTLLAEKQAPIITGISLDDIELEHNTDPQGNTINIEDFFKIENQQLIWIGRIPVTQEGIDLLNGLSLSRGTSDDEVEFETTKEILLQNLKHYQITISAPVVYRISQKNLDDLALETEYDRLKEKLALPQPLESNLTWTNAWDIGLNTVDDVVERVKICTTDKSDVVKGFTERFERLMVGETSPCSDPPESPDQPETPDPKNVKTYRNQLFEFNRPLQEELLQEELPDSLKEHLLLGRRLLRSNSPLTTKEIQQLRGDGTNSGLFEHLADKKAVNRLYNDWRDRQTLDDLYQDWFSQEIISKVLDDAQLAEIPDTLTENLDFPDPTTCALIWRGPLTADDGATDYEAILSALPGDDLFRQAVARLIEQAREIPEDKENEIIRVDAPLGLDQLPKIVKEQLTIESDGAAYNSLSWDGALSPQQADSLLTWADLTRQDDVKEAVNSLVNTSISQQLEPLPMRPTTETLPDNLKGQLQIGTDQLAWVGEVLPTPDQQTALDALTGDQKFEEQRNALLGEISKADPNDHPCVIAVDLEPEQRRPTQDDVPQILKDQLKITETDLIWKGSVSTEEQRLALRNMAGDEAFKWAINNIAGELEQKAKQYPILFGAEIPVRPFEVPTKLKDKLMIGRAVIRYHGMMAKKPAETLRDKVNSKLDKLAIENLYAASLQKGLRDKELQIRTRRVNAALSDPAKLTADKLETTDDQPSTQGAG